MNASPTTYEQWLELINDDRWKNGTPEFKKRAADLFYERIVANDPTIVDKDYAKQVHDLLYQQAISSPIERGIKSFKAALLSSGREIKASLGAPEEGGDRLEQSARQIRQIRDEVRASVGLPPYGVEEGAAEKIGTMLAQTVPSAAGVLVSAAVPPAAPYVSSILLPYYFASARANALAEQSQRIDETSPAKTSSIRRELAADWAGFAEAASELIPLRWIAKLGAKAATRLSIGRAVKMLRRTGNLPAFKRSVVEAFKVVPEVYAVEGGEEAVNQLAQNIGNSVLLGELYSDVGLVSGVGESFLVGGAMGAVTLPSAMVGHKIRSTIEEGKFSRALKKEDVRKAVSKIGGMKDFENALTHYVKNNGIKVESVSDLINVVERFSDDVLRDDDKAVASVEATLKTEKAKHPEAAKATEEKIEPVETKLPPNFGKAPVISETEEQAPPEEVPPPPEEAPPHEEAPLAVEPKPVAEQKPPPTPEELFEIGRNAAKENEYVGKRLLASITGLKPNDPLVSSTLSALKKANVINRGYRSLLFSVETGTPAAPTEEELKVIPSIPLQSVSGKELLARAKFVNDLLQRTEKYPSAENTKNFIDGLASKRFISPQHYDLLMASYSEAHPTTYKALIRQAMNAAGVTDEDVKLVRNATVPEDEASRYAVVKILESRPKAINVRVTEDEKGIRAHIVRSDGKIGENVTERFLRFKQEYEDMAPIRQEEVPKKKKGEPRKKPSRAVKRPRETREEIPEEALEAPPETPEVIEEEPEVPSVSEEVLEEAPKEVPVEVPAEVSKKALKKASKKASKRASKRALEEIPKEVPEEVPEEAPEEAPEEVIEREPTDEEIAAIEAALSETEGNEEAAIRKLLDELPTLESIHVTDENKVIGTLESGKRVDVTSQLADVIPKPAKEYVTFLPEEKVLHLRKVLGFANVIMKDSAKEHPELTNIGFEGQTFKNHSDALKAISDYIRKTYGKRWKTPKGTISREDVRKMNRTLAELSVAVNKKELKDLLKRHIDMASRLGIVASDDSGFLDTKIYSKLIELGAAYIKLGYNGFRRWLRAMREATSRMFSTLQLRSVWKKVKDEPIGFQPEGTEEPEVGIPEGMQARIAKRRRIIALLKERDDEFFRDVGINFDELATVRITRIGETTSAKLAPIPSVVKDHLILQHRSGWSMPAELMLAFGKTFVARAMGDRLTVLRELKRLMEPASSTVGTYLNPEWSGLKDSIGQRVLREVILPEIGVSQERQAELAWLALKDHARPPKGSESPAEDAEYWQKRFKIVHMTDRELVNLAHYMLWMREKAVVLRAVRNKELENIAKEAAESAAFYTARLKDRRTESEVINKATHLLSSAYNGTPEYLLSYITGVDTPLHKKLVNRLIDAASGFAEVKRAVTDAVQSAFPPELHSAFVNNEENRTRVIHLSNKTIMLTPAQLVSIYLRATDPDGGRHARLKGFYGNVSGFPQLSSTADNPLIPPGDVDLVLSQLTPEERSVAAAVRSGYDALIPYIEKIIKRLPPIEQTKFKYEIDRLRGSYAHYTVAGRGANERERLLRDLIQHKVSARVLGALRERADAHSYGIEIGDPFVSLAYASRVVGIIYSRSSVAEELEAIFADPRDPKSNIGRVANILKRTRAGATILHYMRDAITSIHGLYSPAELDAFELANQDLIKRFSQGALAFRLSTIIMQTNAIATASLVIPPKYVLKSLARGIMTKEELDVYAKQSPLFYDRIKTPFWARITPGVTNTFSGVIFDEVSIFDRLTATGLKAMKRIDEISIGYIFRAAVLEGQEKGWTMAQSVRRAEHAIMRTQMTTDDVSQAAIAREAKSGKLAPRLVMLFGNDILKQRNAVRLNIRKYVESAKTPADLDELLWTLCVGLVIIPSIQIVSSIAQRSAVRLPGFIARGRKAEDVLYESAPLSFWNAVTRYVRSVVGSAMGPAGQTLSDVMLSGMAPAVGEKPFGDRGSPVAQAISSVTDIASYAVRLAQTASSAAPEDVEKKRRFALKIAEALTLASTVLFRTPLVAGDIIKYLDDEKRAHYYEMLYKARFHDNGTPRVPQRVRIANYALRRLRELGATPEQIQASIISRRRG